jgi:hypothetical protein
MKVAIVFLALLPIILSMTLEEHDAQWSQMSHEERMSGMCDVKYDFRAVKIFFFPRRHLNPHH